MCSSKTSPCMPGCACCRHTRGRFECTHGGVLSLHTGFSACHTPHATRHSTTTTHHTHHTQPDTPHTRPQTQTTTHNDTTTHTTSHGDRDRERRQRKKTGRREDERIDEKNKMREKKTAARFSSNKGSSASLCTMSSWRSPMHFRVHAAYRTATRQRTEVSKEDERHLDWTSTVKRSGEDSAEWEQEAAGTPSAPIQRRRRLIAATERRRNPP